MRYKAIRIAALVFAFSVLAELLSIHIVLGSVEAWLYHPRRLLLLTSMFAVNLLNAAVAGYLAYRMRHAEQRCDRNERERLVASRYLNHHVRNALSAIQYAACLTKDEYAVRICEGSIARIVRALTTADRGVPESDEIRKIFTPARSTRSTIGRAQ